MKLSILLAALTFFAGSAQAAQTLQSTDASAATTAEAQAETAFGYTTCRDYWNCGHRYRTYYYYGDCGRLLSTRTVHLCC